MKKVFEYRLNKLLQALAMRIGQKIMGKKDPQLFFQAWNNSQIFGIQELAKAYGEYALLYNDIMFIKKLQNKEVKYNSKLKDDSKEVMNLLFQLSHLTRIQRDLGTWYENGYLSSDHGDMIREHIQKILPEIKRFAVNLTDAMKPADSDNDCMLGPGDGDLYKSV